jgi:hypothetical protein
MFSKILQLDKKHQKLMSILRTDDNADNISSTIEDMLSSKDKEAFVTLSDGKKYKLTKVGSTQII